MNTVYRTSPIAFLGTFLLIGSCVLHLPAQTTSRSRDLEPNILLYTGLVEEAAALALKGMPAQGVLEQSEITALRTELEQAMRTLKRAFEERGAELPSGPLQSRHAGFTAAQTVYEQQFLALLDQLAKAPQAEREQPARAMLAWIAQELRRNGIDLENPLRPVSPKILQQPRPPADQGNRVRPVHLQPYIPPSPDDTATDPLWATAWSRLQNEARQWANPDAIIEFVQNEIALEPGFGFQYHPLTTLSRRTGSDFDQAALLVALLRAREIPARFIYFSISTDRTGAARIWQTTDLAQAGEITAAEGRPAVLVKTQPDTPPVRLRLEHIAVQYHDPDSRSWKFVDPSFGRAVPTRRVAIPPNPIPLPEWRDKPWDELTAADQLAWGRVLDSSKTQPIPNPSTPTSGDQAPPYSVGAWLAEFSEIPEGLTLRLAFALETTEGGVSLGPLPMAGVFPPFLTLDAVDADAPQADPVSSPPNHLAQYLVRLHPRWNLPGRAPNVARDLICRSTLPWEIAVTVQRPLMDPVSRRRNLRAGGTMVLSWAPLAPTTTAPALAVAASDYLRALDMFDQAMAEQACVLGVLEPPMLLALAAEPIFLQPLDGFGERGMQVSIDQFWHARTPVRLKPLGDPDQYILASGMVASGLEHRILERTFNTRAISTVQLASACAVDPAARIVPFNSSSQFGVQCYPSTPIDQWSGSAELILETPSFAGRYDLTGGLRGGILTTLQERTPDHILFQNRPSPIPPPLPDSLIAPLASAVSALKAPILTRKPTPLICACWSAEWLLDHWLPWDTTRPPAARP